jgi:hypothetical protein
LGRSSQFSRAIQVPQQLSQNSNASREILCIQVDNTKTGQLFEFGPLLGTLQGWGVRFCNNSLEQGWGVRFCNNDSYLDYKKARLKNFAVW